MNAADFEVLDDTDAERILRWRFEVLVDAGYDSSTALELATHVDIDLHRAAELPRRGCPPATAARILL
jgi:hypothetical protein